ncbi:MAG: hypothetical protein NkDv07_0059 [Candidatus Improbicoccus devescovinae]|nr:MAG: hypothetical protein NkDv07_0059 [Candidatus Improbicoccus devescovinae]
MNDNKKDIKPANNSSNIRKSFASTMALIIFLSSCAEASVFSINPPLLHKTSGKIRRVQATKIHYQEATRPTEYAELDSKSENTTFEDASEKNALWKKILLAGGVSGAGVLGAYCVWKFLLQDKKADPTPATKSGSDNNQKEKIYKLKRINGNENFYDIVRTDEDETSLGKFLKTSDGAIIFCNPHSHPNETSLHFTTDQFSNLNEFGINPDTEIEIKSCEKVPQNADEATQQTNQSTKPEPPSSGSDKKNKKAPPPHC